MIGMFDDRVRVTNTTQIRIEQNLADLAQSQARDRSGVLSVRQIREAIARSGIAFTADQRAAIHALGEGGVLTVLTAGVAGAGKITLLQPLVDAWKADTRYSGQQGRDVIGAAMAWRQADALKRCRNRADLRGFHPALHDRARRVSGYPKHRTGP